MTLSFSYALLLVPLVSLVDAQKGSERIGCTAIAVDGAASVDGTAFAGMNADSSDSDYRLTFVPAQKHSETSRPVFTFDLKYPRFVGFGRGDFYHPQPANQTLSKPVGHIPQVKTTFGYYESTEPLMNDQGLGMGESSCAAMLLNKFPGDEKDTRDVPVGMLDTVTLMQLALERCSTARCAVETMGQLSEEFGFVPTPGEPTTGAVRGRTAWDDAGEAYTVADAKGEAWVFHVVGGVNGITKSVWAAQRVPKGHFAVVANDFIIEELPEEPNEDFAFNTNARRAAVAAGLWDGKGAFHFSKTFAPDPMAFESPAGAIPIPLYASLRRWGLNNLAAPSRQYKFHSNNQEYSFSVPVDKKLTHREVMGFLRYQYEGTEFDLRQGILAGPFGTPFRLEGGPKKGQIPRGISIMRTLYSILVQSGPSKQVGWFAMDTPTTSVYVPLDPRINSVSAIYSSGHNANFTRDCAWWAFNFVSNFMQLNFGAMSVQDVYPAIEAWQDKIDEQYSSLNHDDLNAVSEWQVKVQEDVISSWWKMSDYLIMKYNDGQVNVPSEGRSTAYPMWFADMIGYGNDVHPIWVQRTATPARLVTSDLVGEYIAPLAEVPQTWDEQTKEWSYTPVFTDLATSTDSKSSMMVTHLCGAAGVLVAGIVIGVSLERYGSRSKAAQSNYRALL
eukprot:TRINITY_DN11708_c0_g1_i1.p1 TRINITY_DN11708_c0_g1~~TRINITY_DN11708_c0_g1_i1.p1  ORF type:complete len:671 (+),score=97.16 TRINITY_DN11708_c0_g1_i1:53-2065(+)